MQDIFLLEENTKCFTATKNISQLKNPIPLAKTSTKRSSYKAPKKPDQLDSTGTNYETRRSTPKKRTFLPGSREAFTSSRMSGAGYPLTTLR